MLKTQSADFFLKPFWFVMLRCSIYKVPAALASVSEDELYYSNRSQTVCQALFSFSLKKVFRFAFLSRTAYIVYISRSHLSSTFFDFFQNLFSACHREALFPNSLIRLPLSILFVKHFFQVFSKFFRLLLPFFDLLWYTYKGYGLLIYKETLL